MNFNSLEFLVLFLPATLLLFHRVRMDRRLPVLAHTWGNNLTGLDKAAMRFPEVPFLMGHSGSGFAYEGYLKSAASSPNLYLDLTYSREHTNMIEEFPSCGN